MYLFNDLRWVLKQEKLLKVWLPTLTCVIHGEIRIQIVSVTPKDSDINCGYGTARWIIPLKLKFCEKTTHNKFWKFITALLQDKQYLDKINKLIDSIIVEYAVFPYAKDAANNIPKNELQFLVSDDTLLDFLLMKIRSEMIGYATMNKKKKTFRN